LQNKQHKQSITTDLDNLLNHRISSRAVRRLHRVGGGAPVIFGQHSFIHSFISFIQLRQKDRISADTAATGVLVTNYLKLVRM